VYKRQGVANVKGMLEELKRQQFSGVLAVEYESKPEDNFDEIKQSLQYYNEVVKGW
jgi:sugar phosphate isomerase/epimerase